MHFNVLVAHEYSYCIRTNSNTYTLLSDLIVVFQNCIIIYYTSVKQNKYFWNNRRIATITRKFVQDKECSSRVILLKKFFGKNITKITLLFKHLGGQIRLSAFRFFPSFAILFASIRHRKTPVQTDPYFIRSTCPILLCAGT